MRIQATLTFSRQWMLGIHAWRTSGGFIMFADFGPMTLHFQVSFPPRARI